MMTAFPVRERASELGAKVQAVIQKPFDVFELAELVHDCVEGSRLHDVRRSKPALPSVDGGTDTRVSTQVMPARSEEY